MDYYDTGFAHLATGRGINAKDHSELDSDRMNRALEVLRRSRSG